jgi:CubicO group peptidase (beta-lactamase class C family)
LAPGEGWLYHTSSDVLSALLARAAGRSLGELLTERIAGPLGMPSTGFYTRELDRLATAYIPRADGLEVHAVRDADKPPPATFVDFWDAVYPGL